MGGQEVIPNSSNIQRESALCGSQAALPEAAPQWGCPVCAQGASGYPSSIPRQRVC